jgi:hypothetical protein
MTAGVFLINIVLSLGKAHNLNNKLVLLPISIKNFGKTNNLESNQML